MKGNRFFTVNEFAKFSRTTKDTLLHYDRIGLLSPEKRGANKYRYYSIRLLAVVNVIRTLQRLGMSLDDIKDLKDHRTPEKTCALFTRQIDKIDENINDWVRARKLLFTLQKTINGVAHVDENAITIQYLPAESIILGRLNDYGDERNDYDALFSFYQDISEKYPDLDLNYPVWAVFSKERIEQGDWVWPDRYYFHNPEGRDKRPAALYAIGYARGGYGQSDELYRRMIAFIDSNGFEVSGNTYEEYPLNEICIEKDDNYLIRVLITVREK